MPSRSKRSRQEIRRRFAKEYIVDFQGAEAAIRAGLPKRSAKQRAYEMLQEPEVQEMIRAEIEARAKRTEVTADRVLQEFARIAFLDPRRFFDGERLLLPSELDDDVAAALSSIKVTNRKAAGAGDEKKPSEVEETVEVKACSKIDALDRLSRHLGLYGPNKIAFTDPDGEAPAEMGSVELARAIAFTLAKAVHEQSEQKEPANG